MVLVVVLGWIAGPTGAQPVETTSSTLEGDASPEIHVTGVAPTDTMIYWGNNFSVAAEITNVGDANVTDTVSLDVADTQVVSEEVTLDSNESRSIQLTASDLRLAPGNYNFTVRTSDDNATGTLTIQCGWGAICMYTDEDGIATLDGALMAIDDYENGNLSLERTLAVIESYEEQVPLEELIDEEE